MSGSAASTHPFRNPELLPLAALAQPLVAKNDSHPSFMV